MERAYAACDAVKGNGLRLNTFRNGCLRDEL